MPRVCLLVPTVRTRDAIGHDVAGMYALLRRRGIEVHLLTQDLLPNLPLPVERLTRYADYARQPDTISIYHHSTYWDAGLPLFLGAAGPKIVRYHAVTPASFFAPYSDELAHSTAQGRAQSATLAGSPRVDFFLSDSQYNWRELQELGAPLEHGAVVPPFHTLSALADVPADVSLLERYLDGTCNVLFVGRVAPNKGHRHLLATLHAFRALFDRPMRLFVVGHLDSRLRAYHEELAALARGLRVADATLFTGRVDPAQLKAYYLLAHAFLVMSEHEGFCVPVVEAMAHAVPVVAYDATATGETVADAGLVLSGLDYDHYAAALEIVLTRPDLRAALRARQRARLAERFDAGVVARQFEAALAPWLGPARGDGSDAAGANAAAAPP